MTPRLRLAAIALALCVSASAYSQSAVPVSVFVKSSTTGRGWLFQRLGNCYLLTAGHVLGGNSQASLIGGMNGKVVGRALLLKHWSAEDEDLALMHVQGALARQCGIELDKTPRLETVVNARARGELIEVVEDGGTKRTAIRVGDVGPRFLMIAALDGSDSLYQGQSGGLVTIADAPGGMYLAINGDLGLSRVLRYDVIGRWVNEYFRAPDLAAINPLVPVPGARQKPARGDLFASAAGTRVEANGLPLSPGVGPENLISAGAGPWIADLGTTQGDWLEVDFYFGAANVRTVARVELDSSGVTPPDRRIRDYEVLTRSDEISPWLSQTSGTCVALEDTCFVELAPTRAHGVRLRIHSNWGARDATALAAVRAYATAAQ